MQLRLAGRHNRLRMPAPRRVSAVDAHVAGGVLRLVTSGFPAPRGRTMSEKAQWLRARHDGLCQSLVLEPRGHAGVVLAVLCDPADPSADAGVLFRRAGHFVPFSGHGAMGAAVLALQEGLVHPRQPGRLRLDTGLGTIDIHVDATGEPGGSTARWTSPPAFVLVGGLPVTVGARVLVVDVAWGGAFFAIVDSESAGTPLTPTRWPDFARLARPIAAAIEASIAVTHPTDPARRGIAGVAFVGDPGADRLQCLVAWADGTVEHAASGTGAAALLAVFDAMGFGTGDLRIESLAGVPLSARITGRTQVETVPAVVVDVMAAVWTIARHEFVIDPADPLRHGVLW